MLLKFFIYSILGCGLESVWGLVKTGRFRSRRMLLGLPMCPVYGVGGVLMSVFLSGFRDNLLVLYALGAILASAVELGFFIIGELSFGIMLWDYRDKPYSFMGGVCGEYTVWWGLVAVIFVRYLDPAADYILSGMNAYSELTATVFLAVITLADTVKTTNILKAYRTGDIDKLPDCFWYMEKIS
ncbi:MAG: putative ABC transporter permease [Clostridia bacterium]|nr:putative ABC transporter permease [Clostridia bacterium]